MNTIVNVHVNVSKLHIFFMLLISSHFLSSSSEPIFQLQVPIWSISKHCRKLALVGIIPNQILFFFSSDKLFHLIRLSVLLSLSELKEKRIWKHCSSTHQQVNYRSFLSNFLTEETMTKVKKKTESLFITPPPPTGKR